MTKLIIMFVVMGFLFGACSTDMNTHDHHDSNIAEPVRIAPRDGETISRKTHEVNSIQFQWEKCPSSDGSLVFYTVLIDHSSGDFKHPILEKKPERLGAELMLTLSQPEVDSLVKVGGDDLSFKWIVRASNGVNSHMNAIPYSFNLSMENSSEKDLLRSAADQLMASMVDLYLKDMPLDIWASSYPRSDGFWDGASTVWGQGAMFSGYTALRFMAKDIPDLANKYKTQYEERLLTSIDKFRNRRNGLREAYAAFPGEGDERFYDDNVWIGLDMLDLYELTHDNRYLDRAKMVWNFILSGTDDMMGGGVYWKEGEPSKNTCSTAPSAVMALRLYETTGERHYLDQAKDLYQWLKDVLQDPSDKLFWDNVRLSDPSNPNSSLHIEEQKYTYNAGQPMQTAVLLYKITGEEKYLNDAKEIANAAYNHWFEPFQSATLGREIKLWNQSNLWFNAILLRGFIELYAVDHDPKYIHIYQDIMLHAWNSSDVRNPSTNLINKDFKGMAQSTWDILDQGACIEMFARLANLD